MYDVRSPSNAHPMMRGEIFTEFLEFVAERFGADAASQVTTRGGRRAWAYYVATERYEFDELVYLVDRLAEARGASRAAILVEFGRHLFRYFAALYPAFIGRAGSALGFLEGIDSHVHSDLRKLYPDAAFPEFSCKVLAPGRLEMRYRSTRPLGDLAEGLIRECVEFFGNGVAGAPGTAVRFVLTQA
jgi:Haem-NO-binding